MASFTPGPAVAEIRGSVGGTVFSRNRYGAYMRNRAVPVVSTTSFATNAKARFAAATQAWQTLTAAQQNAWKQYALTNPIVGRLGIPQQLTGHAAYVGLHVRALIAVQTPLVAPPIVSAPAPLTALTATADIGAGAISLIFTVAPTAAAERLWVQAAVIDSAGITYVENSLKLIGLSGVAEASPFDIETLMDARVGSMVVGQYMHIKAAVFSNDTMLLSAPMKTSVIVSTT